MRKLVILFSLLLISGCGQNKVDQSTMSKEVEEAAHAAHGQYVDAINSNNLDSIVNILTDDIVFMASGYPVLEGKAAVKPWVDGYLKAYKTHWDKKVEEFKIIGDYAYERYSYHSKDSSLEDGSVYEDTGWGFLIYRLEADGKWRVARDAWGPDHPAVE